MQSRPCQTETVTDTQRHRSWKHTHLPRDKQDDDAVHAISRGPQGGREGTWDQYTTDTIGGGVGFSFLFFSFFFLVCCLTPAPSLPLCLVLSLFAGSLPSFLSSPKKNNCFAPVSALQMASGAYLFQHNLQLRGRKSNTY